MVAGEITAWGWDTLDMALTRREGTLPAGVRRTLQRAGDVFVKLGRVASTRTDVLPHEWCTELTRLRSSAERLPESVMRRARAAELGADPDEVFASFDWTPVASASIGQMGFPRKSDGVSLLPGWRSACARR